MSEQASQQTEEFSVQQFFVAVREKVTEAISKVAKTTPATARVPFTPVVSAARLVPVLDNRSGEQISANLAIYPEKVFMTVRVEKGDNGHFAPKPAFRRNSAVTEFVAALWGGSAGSGEFLASNLPIHQAVLEHGVFPLVKALDLHEKQFRDAGLLFEKTLRTDEGEEQGTMLAIPLDSFANPDLPHTALCIYGAVMEQGGPIKMDPASWSWAWGTDPSRIRYQSRSGQVGSQRWARGGPGRNALAAKKALATLVEQALSFEDPDNKGKTLGESLSAMKGRFSDQDPRVRDLAFRSRSNGMQVAEKFFAGQIPAPSTPQVRRQRTGASVPAGAPSGDDPSF